MRLGILDVFKDSFLLAVCTLPRIAKNLAMGSDDTTRTKSQFLTAEYIDPGHHLAAHDAREMERQREREREREFNIWG